MESVRLEFSDAPYPGLRPFRPDEADIFFGRERQTDALLERLADHRFLAVVGPSGCGKSSLVTAGMMPALQAGFMVKAGSHWQIAYLRPGGQPMKNLAAALLDTDILEAERANRADAPVFLEAELRRGPLSLLEVVHRSALAPEANLLVLVDQFEELFRYSADTTAARDEAEAFVALLLASAAAPNERVYVTITMRSDFLGECTVFHGLPEAINDGLFLTPRLTREECSAAITGPARVFGGNVEPALVNRLLNDFGPEPDHLPLLQHALLRMWDRHEKERAAKEKTVLAVADYEAIGGLARSLSNHADEALAELSEPDQRVAELMFRRLSDSETPRRDRRSPASVREIIKLAGVTVADVSRVAAVFRRRGRCFLTPREEVALEEGTILDVSHESLLRQWERAKEWVKDEAEMVAFYRRIKEVALEWKRGESALWRAPNLDRAIAWRTRHSPTAAWALRYTREKATEEEKKAEFPIVCAFIDASEKERARSRRGERRVRGLRVVASITFAVIGLFVLGTVSFYFLYRWEQEGFYASYVKVHGAPEGIGELTEDEVRHRPLSYMIVTAGHLGPAKRMYAVNGRGALAEVAPELLGTARGRQLFPSRWQYNYGADGTITSEFQYTRQGELVQGKVYVPQKADERSRLAYFVGSEGSPLPVRGRAEDSAYYWTEEVRYSDEGYEEEIRYFDQDGQRVPGSDRAFAVSSEYDGQGNVVKLTSLDVHGNPMNDSAGNAKFVASRRDERGNMLEARVLDAADAPTRIVEGWAIARFKYDEYGNEVERSFFDEGERPIAGKEGWHKATQKLDEHGNAVEVHYFDAEERPTVDVQSACYGHEVRYEAVDGVDRQERSTCRDAGGAPMRSRDGNVSRTMRHDERGLVEEESFLDADDRLTATRGGYARVRYRHDEKGWLTEAAYFDERDRPVPTRGGYASYRIEYRDGYRFQRTSYLDVDGEPVVLEEGFAIMERTRDIWWNIVEERYLDVRGNPVKTADGTAGWRGTFDTQGRQVEKLFLGTSGETVLNSDGYAGRRDEYDDYGRIIAVDYLGLKQERIRTATQGVAGWRSTFDQRGHEVERKYVDSDGEPAITYQGEAGWRALLDALGHPTELTYLDAAGAPTLRSWGDASRFSGTGFARWTKTFDDRGNETDVAYFDAAGKPAVHPEGWSRAGYEYDDRGKVVRKSYFDREGRPTRLAGSGGGYHSVTFAYDQRGNNVDVRYFAEDRTTPVENKDGYARIVRAYDRYGEMKEETAFGLKDNRVAGGSGVHRRVWVRDGHGRTTREEEYGPANPPKMIRALEYRHDGRGNMLELRQLGPRGQFVTTDEDRCAITTWVWDDQDDLLEKACLGARGRPRGALENGAARIAYTYGRPGERTSERYFDERGRPLDTSCGVGVNYRYDYLGRVSEEACVDEKGHLAATQRGFSRRTFLYDEGGNVVEESMFMEDDRPASPVARVEHEFEFGRRKADRYFDIGQRHGRLAGDGQHETRYEYDVYGNLVALTYRDEHGRSVHGYAREYDGQWRLCRRWVAEYDEDGALKGEGECEDEAALAPPPSEPAKPRKRGTRAKKAD